MVLYRWRDAAGVIWRPVDGRHFPVVKVAGYDHVRLDAGAGHVHHVAAQHGTPTREEGQRQTVRQVRVELFVDAGAWPHLFVDLKEVSASLSIAEATIGQGADSLELRVWSKLERPGRITRIEADLTGAQLVKVRSK